SSNLSASVNALQITKRDYQKLLDNKDSFYEKSQDIVPTFTGGVIDLTRFSESLHGAFNLQSLTQQSSNQNDFLRRPDISIEYFHRSAKSQISEILFGAGFGKRITRDLAFGISLGGKQSLQDQQIYQDVSSIVNPAIVRLKDTGKTLFSTLTTNDRATASTISLELGCGTLWAPWPSLSIGMSAHGDFLFNQKLGSETDALAVFHFQDYSTPSAADFEARDGADEEQVQLAVDKYTNKTLTRQTSNNRQRLLKSNSPTSYLDESYGTGLGRLRVRAGIAFFPSPRFVLSGDAVWHRSMTEWVANRDLVTDDVINFHQGSEYFFTPSLFMRQGLFTNFDARPEKLGALNPERIDFYGTSLFLGTQTADTQFSGGVIYQYGMGEALKIANQRTSKPVRENKYILAFTAAHGL
ncbi:MAG: hypothetical protein RIR26_1468, partial [Pseudomonadota bacterium]